LRAAHVAREGTLNAQTASPCADVPWSDLAIELGWHASKLPIATVSYCLLWRDFHNGESLLDSGRGEPLSADEAMPPRGRYSKDPVALNRRSVVAGYGD
jgi:hypothetical protein